jgi:deoxyribonuclease-4
MHSALNFSRSILSKLVFRGKYSTIIKRENLKSSTSDPAPQSKITSQGRNALLGAHVSITGGIYKAIANGKAIGANAIQIFTKSGRSWTAKDIPANDAAKFKEEVNKSKMKVMVHASYLINIGSNKTDVRDKSLSGLVDELKRCEQLGIPYLVLHPGASTGGDEETCLKLIAQGLNSALAQVPGQCSILLENTAGQGTTIGHKFEQIRRIMDLMFDLKVEKTDSKDTTKGQTSTEGVESSAETPSNNSAKRIPERIGVCLDTCHAFAAGYDIRTQDNYNTMMRQFDDVIGLAALKAIHLNDSKTELGGRVDRHENIGQGKLNMTTFTAIMNDKRLEHVPKVLETPGEDDVYIRELNLLRTLIKSSSGEDASVNNK